MTANLSYLVVQAHRDDLYRDAARHRVNEVRARQLLRHAPPRPVTRRTRTVTVASHHRA